MITEVAVGLVMKILKVVIRKKGRVGAFGEITHVAFFSAIPDRWQVQPNLGVATGPVQPGCVKEQLSWIDALFSFLPITLLQLSHGIAQRLQNVR